MIIFLKLSSAKIKFEKLFFNADPNRDQNEKATGVGTMPQVDVSFIETKYLISPSFAR